MSEPNLLLICATALVAVLLLLSILAALIRVLTAVFPDRGDDPDTALIAAIHTASARAFPGTRVTRVEEIP